MLPRPRFALMPFVMFWTFAVIHRTFTEFLATMDIVDPSRSFWRLHSFNEFYMNVVILGQFSEFLVTADSHGAFIEFSRYSSHSGASLGFWATTVIQEPLVDSSILNNGDHFWLICYRLFRSFLPYHTCVIRRVLKLLSWFWGPPRFNCGLFIKFWMTPLIRVTFTKCLVTTKDL